MDGKTYTAKMLSGDSFTGKFVGRRDAGKKYEHIRLEPKHGMTRTIWVGTIDEITEGK